MGIVLASSSPRRKQLLEQMGLSFTIIPPGCEEDIAFTTPHEYVMLLAGKKAESVLPKLPEGQVVIGADTIVVCQDEVMGKPKNRQDAFRMLQKLSGRSHQVYSGYAILGQEGHAGIRGAEVSQVCFEPLCPWEIEDYLDTKEYVDKAGAYAIQGQGGKFVRSIEGSFATVVGLPIHKVYAGLKQLGEIHE